MMSFKENDRSFWTSEEDTVSRPSFARALGIAAIASVIVTLLVTWFAWPAKEVKPRDLPVVVAGPAPAVAAISQRLQAALPNGFEISTAPDAATADTALRDREAYAAFVSSGTGQLALHTASAASPTVAALLGQAAQQLGGGNPVTIVDVVPGPAEDPRGAGFASGFLPLVLASMVVSVLLSLTIAVKSARVLGLAAFAVVAGLVGAAALRWLGVLDGAYLPSAGAISLLALAIGATIIGLASAIGRAGIAIGVLLVFVLGNPISAVAAAPELLPQPWGTIGQLLPPGAGATLLRSAALFDGARAANPLWTLLAWAAAGLVLLVIGRNRPILPTPSPAAVAIPELNPV
jgi:hypothetical protein